MNEFQKKLFTDLSNGHSVEDLMAEFKRQLDEAVAQKEKEEKLKAQAEAAKAEAKSKEAKAKEITDLANRLLNDQVTSSDVAYVFRAYAKDKWARGEKLLTQFFTDKDVEKMIQQANEMLGLLDPLLKLSGQTWDDFADELAEKQATGELDQMKDQVLGKAVGKKQSDDDILRDWIGRHI